MRTQHYKEIASTPSIADLIDEQEFNPDGSVIAESAIPDCVIAIIGHDPSNPNSEQYFSNAIINIGKSLIDKVIDSSTDDLFASELSPYLDAAIEGVGVTRDINSALVIYQGEGVKEAIAVLDRYFTRMDIPVTSIFPKTLG